MPPKLAPLVFSVFSVSLAAAKSLRLYGNAHAFPFSIFILCLPVFLLPEFGLLCLEWALLRRPDRLPGLLTFGAAVVASATVLFAATAQLSFFLQSGGELNWGDAAAFALDSGGRQVLLSEGRNAALICFGLFAIAWVAKRKLHTYFTVFMGALSAQASSLWPRDVSLSQSSLHRLAVKWKLPGVSQYDALPSAAQPNASAGRAMTRLARLGWALLLAELLIFIAAAFVLDPGLPYGRVLIAIPLFDMFWTAAPSCAGTDWPFTNLISAVYWEAPNGNSKGWAPGSQGRYVKAYTEQVPDWLPDELPSGFGRWEARRNEDYNYTPPDSLLRNSCPGSPLAPITDRFYNPVNDPLKISNLGEDVLEPLRKALASGSVDVRHVVLLELESMREELFPLQRGSNFHQVLAGSPQDEEDVDFINERFSSMTPNFEKITGKPGNFSRVNGDPFPQPDGATTWESHPRPGYGGINVVGAQSAGSITTKVSGVINCGTWPVPVNMFEEAELENYQPCFTQILQLFNNMKSGSGATGHDYREQQWNPAFFQSITDSFDRQDMFNEKIGFNFSVTREKIDMDSGPGNEPEEINYFGYAETELRQYIKDYIGNATANGQRMFLSHFTSTTHHPWATPADFPLTDYMTFRHGHLEESNEEMNSYLNTIRFTDAWLGEFMQILEDSGVANETLVVIIGDHGQAFEVDYSTTGTYQNPHISNFRVPLVFYHPLIPQVQHHAKATSISVVPTILDLLISTGSLNDRDKAAAADLLQDYEGQSLIRPYKTAYRGRRAWNFGVVNPGGEIVMVTSADTTWRAAIPWDELTEFYFSDLQTDPLELDRIAAWSMSSLVKAVRRKHGDVAAAWLTEAEQVAHWWAKDRRRLWQYDGEDFVA